MRALWALPLLLAGACASEAITVRKGAKRVSEDMGVVVGRFGLGTRRPIAAERFELTAVQLPDATKYQIPFGPPDDEGRTAVFQVNLPAGLYRLTRWTVAAKAHSWGGEDTGIALRIDAGAVACVGTILLAPRAEARAFVDDHGPPPAPEVRDDCADLIPRLAARAPALAKRAVVRLAQPVSGGARPCCAE